MTSEKISENRGEAIKEHNIKTDDMTLHYTLYHKILADEGRSSYSVSVSVTCGGENESAYAIDITSLHDCAVAIFDAVCTGTVTPCTLYDILEDML